MVPEAPNYIQFFPTLRCNQDCDFCFNRDLPLFEDMSGDKIPIFLRILSKAKIQEIDILGGEPTLYPYLFDIFDKAQKDNIQVFLSTNGTNIKILEKLSKRYNDKKHFSLGISLNNANKEIPKELLNFILQHKPILKGVASKNSNIPYFLDSIHHIKDLRYNLLFMDAVFPSDLNKCLSFSDYLSMLFNLKRRYKNIEGIYCSGFIPNGKEIEILKKVRCPAGTTKLSVMPDGSVYPCYLLARFQKFRLGNIFDDDFKKIWGSPVLDIFRRFYGNKCSLTRCDLFQQCHGGCPAQSMLLLNEIKDGDPRCIHKSIMQ